MIGIISYCHIRLSYLFCPHNHYYLLLSYSFFHFCLSFFLCPHYYFCSWPFRCVSSPITYGVFLLSLCIICMSYTTMRCPLLALHSLIVIVRSFFDLISNLLVLKEEEDYYDIIILAFPLDYLLNREKIQKG